MKNPVPEVALPYVCDYFQILLARLLNPVADVAGALRHRFIGRTGVPEGISAILQRLMLERGFIVVRSYFNTPGTGPTYVVWYQLTARGYLVALELARQKRVDSAGPI